MTSKKFLVVLVVPFLFASCGSKKETITPQIHDITESVYASGIVKSKNQHEIYSKVNGILEKEWVKEGSKVKKGDTLFLINNSASRFAKDNAQIAAAAADYQTNMDKLNEASIQITVATKKMQTDSLLFVRQKNLWEKNIGTRVEYEQRELAYENSKSQLNSARVHYEELNRQIKLASAQSKNNYQSARAFDDDLYIKSDVDGIIYKVNKEVGEMVTALAPLAITGSGDDFVIELKIDEFDVVKVKPGQKAYVAMDSYKGQVFEATITELDPMMNERTRNFKSEAVFDKKPDALFPNLTAEANILIRTKKNVLTIPRAFLINDSLIMLEDGSLKSVQAGLMDLSLAEIVSGINAETKLIRPGK